MAEVHPEVLDLLEGLLQSPLAPLATRALESLDLDDPSFEESEEVTRERTGIASGEGEERARVLRQLDRVDAAISIPLKRELELTRSIRLLAERLGLKSVSILPPEEPAIDGEDGAADDLLAERRREAISAFLEVWSTAVSDTRQRWS